MPIRQMLGQCWAHLVHVEQLGQPLCGHVRVNAAVHELHACMAGMERERLAAAPAATAHSAPSMKYGTSRPCRLFAMSCTGRIKPGSAQEAVTALRSSTCGAVKQFSRVACEAPPEP